MLLTSYIHFDRLHSLQRLSVAVFHCVLCICSLFMIQDIVFLIVYCSAGLCIYYIDTLKLHICA